MYVDACICAIHEMKSCIVYTVYLCGYCAYVLCIGTHAYNMTPA